MELALKTSMGHPGHLESSLAAKTLANRSCVLRPNSYERPAVPFQASIVSGRTAYTFVVMTADNSITIYLDLARDRRTRIRCCESV